MQRRAFARLAGLALALAWLPSNSSQYADVKDASQQGKQRGQTFTWDVVNNVQRRGRQLTETSTMPETNFTIAQSTLTITEAGQAVPYAGFLEDLAKYSVRKPIMQALRNDTAKSMDYLAWVQFNSCILRVVGTSTSAISLTTNGTATSTNSVAFNNSHHKAIVDTMKERNIPFFTGDNYMAIAWPSTLRTFKNNLESIHQYTESGAQLIYNGEVGRYENTRFIEQTNIPHGGAANATTFDPLTDTSQNWSNGLSDWIFFCGEDTVAEAVNTPEEIRAKIPGDYGRSKGVAWYYIGGYGLVHTQVAECRVVKWDSAA